MNVNVPYEDMIRPVQGPQNPFDSRKLPNQNALAGHVEEEMMTEHAFRQQHLTHEILGYSHNPSTDPNAPRILGAVERAEANGFRTLDGVGTTKASRRELKRKRQAKGDLGVIDGDGEYVGPWAKWEGDDDKGVVIPEGAAAPVEGDIEVDDGFEDAELEIKKGRPKKSAHAQESSIFHGKSLVDYQGRTYMDPPIADAPHILGEAGSQDCFVPKECIHTWTGHTGAVSAIRLFPQTGHLLLSSSMDTKVKVRIQFAKSAICLCLRQVVGCVSARKLLAHVYGPHQGCQGYHILQRWPKIPELWFWSADETLGYRNWYGFLRPVVERLMTFCPAGQCIKAFSNGKIPHVIKFHPDEDKQHIFLAGMSDKKIIQVRSSFY
jgi:pre-mRNA-processing factor 17